MGTVNQAKQQYTGPPIVVDRLQLYSEFYKDYNIDEIAKHYQTNKKAK